MLCGYVNVYVNTSCPIENRLTLSQHCVLNHWHIYLYSRVDSTYIIYGDLRFSILHHRCMIHKQQLGYNQFLKV